MWLLTLSQKMFPREDGVEYEFLFKNRPSREDLIKAVDRLFERMKDYPQFVDYHQFIKTDVRKIEWLDEDSNGGGHGTEEMYLHWKQIEVEEQG